MHQNGKEGAVGLLELIARFTSFADECGSRLRSYVAAAPGRKLASLAAITKAFYKTTNITESEAKLSQNSVMKESR